MKEYKNLLFKKHDLFDSSENEEFKKLLRFEIKEIIDGVKCPDAQDFHILGLVYYENSKDDLDIKKSHEYFKEALQVDNNYNMARLYSAHCYHDQGNYSKALEDYLAVNSKELKSDYPLWRYVKLQEQIGYCYHQLGNTTKAKICFDNVLNFYKNEPYEELVDPLEIYQCLNENDEIYRSLKVIESRGL